VLAVDADNTELNTLTITGAIGPEADSSISVKEQDHNPRSVSRQAGGGIYNVNSGIALKHVRIENNRTTWGGGMYTIANGSNTSPKLSDVEFFGNTAFESGGGMYNRSAGSNCIPEISNSRFIENKAVTGGGGMYNSGANCVPSVTSTTFTSNSAKDGGGIFNDAGNRDWPLTFENIIVEENWTSGSGSGIYNNGAALFMNFDLRKNESKGGNGIGIYNNGFLQMTNTAITGNRKIAGAPAGGGLYNAGTAVLANVNVRDNSASWGGGIANSGRLILANTHITENEANTAGGIYNTSMENRTASAVLVNVTIADNDGGQQGGGIYNQYEGHPDGADTPGSVNVLLTNVRITGNSGGAIFNHYYRYKGKGINLTLNNVTIADNVNPGLQYGGAIFTWKDTSSSGEAYDPTNPATFPVFIRVRNSVIYDNPGQSGSPSNSYWIWGDSLPGTPCPPTEETYAHSLVQGILPAGGADLGGNLDGTAALPGFVGPGDYRPLLGSSPLVGAADSSYYPRKANQAASADETLAQLFWKIGGDGGLTSFISSLPFYTSSPPPPLKFRPIHHFLGYDNSYNVGDLRGNGGNEGPGNKARPGASLDIGAYQRE
jgi:hypothetical protein